MNIVSGTTINYKFKDLLGQNQSIDLTVLIDFDMEIVRNDVRQLGHVNDNEFELNVLLHILSKKYVEIIDGDCKTINSILIMRVEQAENKILQLEEELESISTRCRISVNQLTMLQHNLKDAIACIEC